MPECQAKVIVEGRTIDYTIVRSRRRRKTMTITVGSHADVVVAVPLRTSTVQVQDFVVKRASWILRHLAARPPEMPRRQFVSGETVPYLGRQVLLVVMPVTARRISVDFDGEALEVRVPMTLEGEGRRAGVERAVVRWYRACATDELTARAANWSTLSGYAAGRVLVRDQRRRWGSCSVDRTLRFNWRLIMAPPDLIDYVVVHELAHLREPNHSPAFWAEVARLLPDYRLRRTRLKQVGPTLRL